MITKQPLHALGWALYLGCSWTWCIGMFLPCLLLRDFGWASWIYFTVPNVVGAAAMGFVLANPTVSENFVERHRLASSIFSIITILFQIYFLFWAVSKLTIPVGWMWCLLALLGLLYGAGRSLGLGSIMIAGAVYIFSVIAMVFFTKSLPFTTTSLQDPVFGELASQLGYLVPVFIFGFSFCPYLDLTFHHARQQTSPGAGKLAFVIGFGVVFLSMLVCTLIYAPSMIHAFFGVPQGAEVGYQINQSSNLVMLLFTHLFLQAGLTAVFHLHKLMQQTQQSRTRELFFTLAIVVTAFVLWGGGRHWSLFGLSGHELIYRGFMGFYGLFAPAYIWICVIPFKTQARNPKLDWKLLGIAIALALPLYAWAFMAGEYRALIPGLALVLIMPVVRTRLC